MSTRDWDDIAAAIGQATGEHFAVEQAAPVGGGCINAAYRLEGGGRSYFVKLNSAAQLDMFEAEAQGLREMSGTDTVRVPEPVAWGTRGDQAWLAMEFLPTGRETPQAMERFGHELARMHRRTQPRFGWHRDNTIGSTPQINTPDEDWPAFWRAHRLGFQLELAARNGYGGSLQRKGEALLDSFPRLFGSHRPAPSLLHGDLWSGNYAVAADGAPLIFDPAVYYGDREADLAMTELFGGFSAAFYAAYREEWPLDAGYELRKVLYNLYHVLNHLNLFGGGYRSQAEHMMDRLLGELG